MGSIAAALSSICVFALLTLVDVAKNFGIATNVPPVIFSLLGAAAIWAVLYVVFNSYIWRWPWVSKALKAPNVSGTYAVTGETLTEAGQPKHTWEGELTITQSWDRIRVRLRTINSISHSVAGSLFYDPEDGYRLLYHYRNDPSVVSAELTSHRGFADILFSPDLQSATGEYFNGQGRFTFGRLLLTK